MDKKNGETQVRQNDANNSGDYERGLKVLARIIARSIIQQQAKSKQAAIKRQASSTPESSP